MIEVKRGHLTEEAKVIKFNNIFDVLQLIK